jgi:hypothetical protein
VGSWAARVFYCWTCWPICGAVGPAVCFPLESATALFKLEMKIF